MRRFYVVRNGFAAVSRDALARLVFALGVVLALGLVSPGWAENSGSTVSELHVENAWVRAPALPGRPGALYFTIVNGTKAADRLVGVTSPDCGRAELHNHLHEDGVMRMRKVEGVDIPAGGSVAFAPSGYHVMLFDLEDSVVPGGTLKATLEFVKAGRVTIEAEVRPLNSGH